MKPTGFYLLKDDYIDIIHSLGGRYTDNKDRPIYCCIQDKDNLEIYWAIPTSSVANRPTSQLERITRLCTLPDNDIRSCYYHIGHTNRPAIFKISNVLPITDKYIDREYTSQGKHLILRKTSLADAISKKLSRILYDEKLHPDKYEQKITSLYKYLESQLIQDKKIMYDAIPKDSLKERGATVGQKQKAAELFGRVEHGIN